MADTTLILGDVTFAGLEVPASIKFGGEQRLCVHELVGGARVIDAMGRADHPLEWGGWFLGADAVSRAQLLDSLRISGAVQTLAWDRFQYQVIVRSFAADFQRFYQVPYRISCEVVSDQTQPVTSPPSPPIDQAINSDASAAGVLAAAIGDSPLSAAISSMQSAIGAVTSFVTAPISQLNAIAQSVNAAATRVGALTVSVTAAIGTPVTFGGVTAGFGGGSIAALTAQTANCLQLQNLQNMQGILGRISGNLNSVDNSPNTIAVAGGSLYQIAAEQYDDATAWTAIAKANDLTDPFVQGVQQLIIPPQSDQSGGILGN